MKFKRVLVRELDGTEKIRLELERRLIRPNFKFEDEIEECAWEFGMEECILPFLKEEIYKYLHGLRRNDVKYLYGCPYCNFKSKFFYGVDLHIAYSEKCWKYSKGQPCYPINHCIHIPTGRSYLT